MKEFKDLNPSLLWNFFLEICQVPRPSKKEEKIIQYLIDFGKNHNLETDKDKAGNIIIRKKASRGKENIIPVILQSHMDMVGEKLSEINHNFETDPIDSYIDGDWIKAKGTTLGADDGIGMAAQLAVLSSTEIKHGPLECLFTVDEETGLTGAFGLEKNFLKGDILINLDSEDEGELFIGCAGGKDTIIDLEYKKEIIPNNYDAYHIVISGLKGGHSGDEIDKGLGNSIKILNRFIWNALEEFGLRISSFSGGKFRNAIPREAEAIILLPKNNSNLYIDKFNILKSDILNELFITESELKLTLSETKVPEFVIDKESHENFVNSIYACPHGVYEMSRTMPGMVETSTNLASVRFNKDKIQITTNQRSSVESAKSDIANTVKTVFLLAGANVTHSNEYPGWTPKTESNILDISKNSYLKLFNIEPIVRSIHAGLECGLFLEKYSHLDMISFGPTLKGVHSPEEKLSISTTQKFWDLLIDILLNINIKN